MNGSWLPKLFGIVAAFAVTFSLADISPTVTKVANAVNGGCVAALGMVVRQNNKRSEDVIKTRVDAK